MASAYAFIQADATAWGVVPPDLRPMLSDPSTINTVSLGPLAPPEVGAESLDFGCQNGRASARATSTSGKNQTM